MPLLFCWPPLPAAHHGEHRNCTGCCWHCLQESMDSGQSCKSLWGRLVGARVSVPCSPRWPPAPSPPGIQARSPAKGRGCSLPCFPLGWSSLPSSRPLCLANYSGTVFSLHLHHYRHCCYCFAERFLLPPCHFVSLPDIQGKKSSLRSCWPSVDDFLVGSVLPRHQICPEVSEPQQWAEGLGTSWNPYYAYLYFRADDWTRSLWKLTFSYPFHTKKYPLHYPYFSLMFNKVHFLELMSVRYPWEKTDKIEKG